MWVHRAGHSGETEQNTSLHPLLFCFVIVDPCDQLPQNLCPRPVHNEENLGQWARINPFSTKLLLREYFVTATGKRIKWVKSLLHQHNCNAHIKIWVQWCMLEISELGRQIPEAFVVSQTSLMGKLRVPAVSTRAYMFKLDLTAWIRPGPLLLNNLHCDLTALDL